MITPNEIKKANLFFKNFDNNFVIKFIKNKPKKVTKNKKSIKKILFSSDKFAKLKVNNNNKNTLFKSQEIKKSKLKNKTKNALKWINSINFNNVNNNYYYINNYKKTLKKLDEYKL